jgi:hypothetical protein
MALDAARLEDRQRLLLEIEGLIGSRRLLTAGLGREKAIQEQQPEGRYREGSMRGANRYREEVGEHDGIMGVEEEAALARFFIPDRSWSIASQDLSRNRAFLFNRCVQKNRIGSPSRTPFLACDLNRMKKPWKHWFDNSKGGTIQFKSGSLLKSIVARSMFQEGQR